MLTKINPTHIPLDENAIHVAVLYGGMSNEREVSLSSGEVVIKNLIEMGYKVTPLDMGTDISQVVAGLEPDVVFNALHGTYGEDGCIQGILDILNIPYTHSGLLASALAFDKIHSQNLFISHGILCPERKIISKKDNLDVDPMPRPYVIKPISEGSSVGVILVFEEDEFNFADYDFPYGNEIIVENYIPGKEIQVAVVGGRAIGTLEIIPLKARFYDYKTKYTDGYAKHICPASLSEEVSKKALEISEKAHHLLGCKGATRVEFRFDDKKDKMYLLEINTHPGLTPLSIVPEIALKTQDIDFKKLIKNLIDEALNGFSQKGKAEKLQKENLAV